MDSEPTLEPFRIREEPYYCSTQDEVSLFEAAHASRMPVMLKGPTGSGKTRFVQYMAFRLGLPLISVACNEEMSASDLLGRFLLEESTTRWQDGPLTQAVRSGALCYLDEVAEARQDTIVVIHSLTDDRRLLALASKSEVVRAHPDFHLVISHNPGYQSSLKDLKPSTKQRFAALDFGYPGRELEIKIVEREAKVGAEIAAKLVSVAEGSRRLKGRGLDEGASTRMLVHAGVLIARGVPAEAACRMAVVDPLTDDADLLTALRAMVRACL